ncbi:MAG: acyl-CoA dehydrogenase, partial [Methylobacteriaceae bacterium]|nr:acyl-CoA dehydrogenase [Methylobacteriaceae bacterium]
MSAAIQTRPADPSPDLASLARDASAEIDALLAEATRRVRARVVEGDRISAAKLDAEQH